MSALPTSNTFANKGNPSVTPPSGNVALGSSLDANFAACAPVLTNTSYYTLNYPDSVALATIATQNGAATNGLTNTTSKAFYNLTNALNPASTPLTGAEIVTIVQGGIPVNVALSQIGTGGSGGTYAYTVTQVIAAANQTSFSVAYTPGSIQVHQNGLLLDTNAYTAASGATVVLNVGAASGDTLIFVVFTVFNIANAANLTLSNVNWASLPYSTLLAIAQALISSGAAAAAGFIES